MESIETKNAQIKTATVEVRVLTLNGKQMTLSVFKQLQEVPVIDRDTGKLLGDVWGSVNYHVGRCKGWGQHAHAHIVYQRDGRLFRDLVDYEETHQTYHRLHREVSEAIETQALSGLLDGTLTVTNRGVEGTVTVATKPWRVTTEFDIYLRVALGLEEPSDYWGPKTVEEARKFVEYKIADINPDCTPEQAQERFYSFRDNYSASIRAVRDAEQLFIAI